MTQIVSDFGFSPLDNVINYEVYGVKLRKQVKQ